MQLAEQRVPGLKTFVAFLDDLPGFDELRRHHQFRQTRFVDEEAYQSALRQLTPGAQFTIYPARRRKLEAMCESAFGPSEDFAAIAKDVSRRTDAGNMVDMAEHIGIRQHALLGLDEQVFVRNAKPGSAVILLGERKSTAVQVTAEQTGIDRMFCTVSSKVNPHRAMFWHEMGHLQQKFLLEKPILRRDEELACDRNVVDTCRALGDTPTADFQVALRTLASFTGGPESHVYWWPLQLAGQAVDPEEEMLSLLELKARGAGLPMNVPAAIMRAYEGDSGISVQSKLSRLQREHATQGYLFSESRDLAECVQAAAHQLAPGVFKRELKFS